MSKFFQQSDDDEEIEEMEKIEEEKPSTKIEEKQKKTKKDKKKKKKQNDLKEFEEEIKQVDGVVVQESKEEKQPEEGKKENEEKEEEGENQEEQNEQEGNNDEKSKAQKKKEKKKKQAEKKAQGKDQEEKQPTQSKKQEKEKPMTAMAKLALEKRLQKEAEEKRIKEEEERLRREEEERIRKEEEEEKRRQEELERKKQEKKEKIKKLKEKGEYLTDKQKKDREKLELQRQLMLGTNNPEITQEEVQQEKVSNVVKKNKKKPKKQEQEVEQQQQEEKKAEEEQKQKEKEKEEKEKEEKEKEEKEKEEKPVEDLQKMKEKIQQKQVNSDQEDWEALLDSDEEKQKEEEEAKQKQKQKQKEKEEAEVPQEAKKKDKKHEKLSREEDQRNQLDQKLRRELFSQFTSQGSLRSPICCILGHVDTGKTTLLDKIRNTNVQEGEAGGITQQIGATFFPGNKLREETKKCEKFFPVQTNIPGLLIIDTPGHESFSNLRSRGSSLCDLAILVIDLMHGLEKQTLESLELLRMRKTPFVIALNKIDRCFEWKKVNMASSWVQLQGQKQTVRDDYENRKAQLFTQLGEKGFNVVEYWNNSDPKSYVSIVPTSGITGEGIPDLLSVIVKYTSQFLKSKIKVKEENFNCTVLERKEIEGYGATIDCILVDGVLRKNDRIMVQGFNGPITTKIKAILTPHPMKEIRVKGEYLQHDTLYAAMGLKIAASGLDEAVAGTQMYVVNDDSMLHEAQEQLQRDYDDVKNKFQLKPLGVGVAASTLGSLEALLQFLYKSDIPVSYVSVGPVSKDDVMKALKNVLSENPHQRKKEFACMLVFDIKVLPEAKEYAEQNQIRIFEANIIYHLFDQFMQYVKDIQDETKRAEGKDAIFPCVLQPVAFFNKKDPLILGVDVARGVLRPGTPIAVFNDTRLKVGVVESIEANKKTIKEAKPATGSVAIRVKTDGNILAGRHFELTDQLASIISRHSIDMLKKHFKEDLTLDEWALVKDLKSFYKII